MKYIEIPTKPKIVEAKQWFKHGDHPNVEKDPFLNTLDENKNCSLCHSLYKNHGKIPIENLERAKTVCPGDFIITNEYGQHTPMKPKYFKKLYKPLIKNKPQKINKKIDGQTQGWFNLIVGK